METDVTLNLQTGKQTREVALPEWAGILNLDPKSVVLRGQQRLRSVKSFTRPDVW